MTTTIPFTEFPKIPRLRRDIVITEKIDGTNASILVPEDGGPLIAGSRTRWITPEDDNFGFARWVKDHEEELRAGSAATVSRRSGSRSSTSAGGRQARRRSARWCRRSTRARGRRRPST